MNFINRFYLAILGLALAVALTFSLFCITDGLRTQTQKSLENRQIDLYVVPKSTTLTPFFDEFGNPAARLSSNLISAVSQNPNVTAVAPVIPVTLFAKGAWLHLTGIEPDRFPLFYPSPYRVKFGGMMIARSDTAILGLRLAENLNANAGYLITLGDHDLRVSGVLSKTGAIEDYQAFVPLKEAMMLTRKSCCPVLYVQVNGEKSADETKKEILQDHPDTDVYTTQEYFQPTFYFLDRLTIVQSTIIALAVLLALILLSGIFLAVTESRKKEYAIFQAFGASRFKIFYWMIQDGLLVFLIGTVCGLIFGILGANLINEIVVSIFHLAFPVAGFSPSVVGLTIGISFLASALSLLGPAFIIANINLFQELERQSCD